MSRPSEPTYTLTGHHLGESAKAVKFQVFSIKRDSTGEELEQEDQKTQWFPFSQIQKITRSEDPEDMDTLTVKEWILIQKEMI